MQVHKVLEFVDEAVYLKIGKHLNDLQRGIIEGTLNRKKYSDIAESYGCSSGHAKDMGYELLQLLSDVFEETVDKGNLKSVLERQGNLNISLGERSINSHTICCLNVGAEEANVTPNKSNPKNQTKIETINKLRKFGLSDEQIAVALELPLEEVKQVDLEG